MSFVRNDVAPRALSPTAPMAQRRHRVLNSTILIAQILTHVKPMMTRGVAERKTKETATQQQEQQEQQQHHYRDDRHSIDYTPRMMEDMRGSASMAGHGNNRTREGPPGSTDLSAPQVLAKPGTQAWALVVHEVRSYDFGF